MTVTFSVVSLRCRLKVGGVSERYGPVIRCPWLIDLGVGFETGDLELISVQRAFLIEHSKEVSVENAPRTLPESTQNQH